MSSALPAIDPPVRELRGNVSAIACSALLALAHCLLPGPSVTPLSVARPALVLGWVDGRYRSLRLCIALHMLMNLIRTTAGQWPAPYPRAL